MSNTFRVVIGAQGLFGSVTSVLCMNALAAPVTFDLKVAWFGVGLILFTSVLFLGVATFTGKK